MLEKTYEKKKMKTKNKSNFRLKVLMKKFSCVFYDSIMFMNIKIL